MNAIPSDVAVTVVSIPEPGILEAIGVEAPFGGRPQPEVVVDSRRLGTVRNGNRVCGVVLVPGLGHLHLAEDPGVQHLASPGRDLSGAHLGSVLDNTLGPPGSLHQHPTLTEHVAGGLFHIDILTRLQGPDGDGDVPVMGRRHHQRVDGGIIQDSAEVLHHPGPFSGTMAAPSLPPAPRSPGSRRRRWHTRHRVPPEGLNQQPFE